MPRFHQTIAVALALLAASVPLWAQASPAASPSTSPAAAPKKARVALVRLSDTLMERPESFSLSLSSLMASGKAPALSTLMGIFNQAAADKTLSGVLIDLSAFDLELNQAQELGTLISAIRKSGKRVAIYSPDYSTATYILASYADTIIMPEQGDVLIPGAGIQMIFFKDALAKLKMSADFVQVGKFKGAEEPFTRSSASPEYRQQIEKLVDGMYSEIVSTIAANRPNLTEDQVKKAVDQGWLSGRHAREMGLVDQTITRNNLESWVSSQFPSGATLVEDYGLPKKKALNLDSPFAIFSLLGDTAKPRSRAPGIAVIYATGEIVGDTVGLEGSTDYVTPANIRAAVRTALDDDNVKAIVLRVDSPGGSASASDEIWSLLKEADKRKPVTVSMGHLAASGGYYISCAGRSITADPATITGSIGVVGGKIVLKGTLDWAGINIEPVERGAHAEMLSMLRPFTDEERAFVQKSMEEVYSVFESRVTAARGPKVAHLEEVAQGRLFTGEQAKEAGLVDNVGTLNDVVKAAAKNAGLGENCQLLILPEPKSLSDILREGLLSDVRTPVTLGGIKFDALEGLLNSLPDDVRLPTRRALRLLNTLQSERVLMAMPPGLIESHARHR